MKSTDSLQIHKDGQSFSLRVEVADLKYWQDEDMPVILIVYDGRTDKAWWLNVQKYLNETNVVLDALPDKRDRLTLRIPLKNRLLQRSIVRFRQFRNEALTKRRVVSDE